MAEHYTQGRQGQGARRHRNRNNQGPRRRRMPRADRAPKKAPSLLARVLSFFGFGKSKKNRGKEVKPVRGERDQKPKDRKERPKRGARPERGERRRANSTLPTDKARLYVGNLAYEVSESELEELFKGFGNVRSVEIIYNPRTYKSKGYGFVEMQRLESARQAAEVLHGQPFMGRELTVSAASDRVDGEGCETEEFSPSESAEKAAQQEAAAAGNSEQNA